MIQVDSAKLEPEVQILSPQPVYCFLYYTSMSLGSGVPRQSSHDNSRSFRKNHSRCSRRISRLLVQPLPRGHFASVHVEIHSIVEEHMTPRAEARPISRERALLIRRREGAAGGGKHYKRKVLGTTTQSVRRACFPKPRLELRFCL